jgi:porphobilinogen synthase
MTNSMRPRRLRRTPAMRALVRETRLHPAQLVAPMFIVPGSGVRTPVSSMPGVDNLSIDEAIKQIAGWWELGLRSVILFGVPEHKDATGSSGTDPDGLIPQAIRAIKAAYPDLIVMADLCLCEYTDHGHCGVISDKGEVLNDPTLAILAQGALAYANAGADIIAPSDMMDGRVAAIREALDQHGHSEIPILSYAVKYASAFYGPFREAAQSTPQFGDRRSYQMDPPNVREAIKEALLDLAEGADMLMVKPALPYLDVLYQVKQACDVPVAAYCVSGEYAMIKAAAANGWIDERRIVMEALISIRRAGADFILTYHAADAARWLAEDPQ